MTDFDVFWAMYPRKQGKADARKAFSQTAAVRPPMEQLLEAVDNAKRYCESWKRDDGKFIPLPASWLRGERWDDEFKIDLKPRPRVAPPVVAPVVEPELMDKDRARAALDAIRASIKRVPA